MEEDYVQLPVPGKQGAYGSTTGRGAIGPLPASHPAPLSRLIFRDLKLLITLNQEEEQAGESAKNETVKLKICILATSTFDAVYYSVFEAFKSLLCTSAFVTFTSLSHFSLQM